MKSNNKCIYCNSEVKGQRQHFCSDVCNAKYWKGVYSKKWKEGDSANGDKPTQEELEKVQKRYKARKLAYKKYKIGSSFKCDICGEETKQIHRHHEDYDNPDVCILLCLKCHGFVKRYNSLKRMLYRVEKEVEIR